MPVASSTVQVETLAQGTLFTIAPSNDSTLAVEVAKTRLMRKKKHLVFFEKFEGQLFYDARHPEKSRVNMVIDARNALCRDKWLSARKQKAVTRYVIDEILRADQYPEIRFTSIAVRAKPLRGFTVDGVVTFRDKNVNTKLNVVLTEPKPGLLQIDGDATLRLADLGVKPPSSLGGLIGTKNDMLVRMLLWAKQHA